MAWATPTTRPAPLTFTHCASDTQNAPVAPGLDTGQDEPLSSHSRQVAQSRDISVYSTRVQTKCLSILTLVPWDVWGTQHPTLLILQLRFPVTWPSLPPSLPASQATTPEALKPGREALSPCCSFHCSLAPLSQKSSPGAAMTTGQVLHKQPLTELEFLITEFLETLDITAEEKLIQRLSRIFPIFPHFQQLGPSTSLSQHRPL